MQADARQLVFLGYNVLYPQRDRFEGNELAELYSLIHGIYPLETCTHHGDSAAVMETEGWVTAKVERERFSYQERLREAFGVAQGRSVNVFEMTKVHLEIPVFLVQKVTIRELWASTPGDASIIEQLRDKALKLTPEQYQELGTDVSAGLHFVGNQDAPEFHWHLELDPRHADETSLYIQLQTYFGEPHETTAGLNDALQATYGFLEDNVTKFVLGMLS